MTREDWAALRWRDLATVGRRVSVVLFPVERLNFADWRSAEELPTSGTQDIQHSGPQK